MWVWVRYTSSSSLASTDWWVSPRRPLFPHRTDPQEGADRPPSFVPTCLTWTEGTDLLPFPAADGKDQTTYVSGR